MIRTDNNTHISISSSGNSINHINNNNSTILCHRQVQGTARVTRALAEIGHSTINRNPQSTEVLKMDAAPICSLGITYKTRIMNRDWSFFSREALRGRARMGKRTALRLYTWTAHSKAFCIFRIFLHTPTQSSQ